MYAVIETGGKQYRVEEGKEIKIEKLNAEVGETVEFDRVIAVNNGEALKVGLPLVEGAMVKGRVLEHGRGRKIIVFKYKPKKNYRRKQGHRQAFTRVLIETITI